MILVHFSDNSAKKSHTMILFYTFTFECLACYKVRKETATQPKVTYSSHIFSCLFSLSYFSHFRKKSFWFRRENGFV